LQSVRVRYSRENDRYVLISGERRWRAAKLGGIPQLAVRIIDGELTPGELLEAQLVENIHRQDLNAVELATAYQALIDKHGWNVTVLAQELSISAGSVSRTLSLLRLPEAAKDFVREGTLAPSVAYEIARLDGPEEQAALAHRVVKEGLSREAAVAAVQRKIGRKAQSAGKPARRVVCPAGNGISVTVAASAEELTIDGLIAALETVLKKARKARGQGVAVDKLPGLLKGPPAKPGNPAGDAQQPDGS
jgi:ParB family chromosome partitioning protein